MKLTTSQAKIYNKLILGEMDNFILGLDRSPNAHKRFVSHIYRGTFSNPGNPMCKRGWNRGKDGYSIWRNNIGLRGVCSICLKAVDKEINNHDTTS